MVSAGIALMMNVHIYIHNDLCACVRACVRADNFCMVSYSSLTLVGDLSLTDKRILRWSAFVVCGLCGAKTSTTVV